LYATFYTLQTRI